MPRYENTGSNVSDWCTETGEGSTTHDICAECAVDFERDSLADEGDKLELFGRGEPRGYGGWVGDVEHPHYDWTEYHCAICGRELDEDVDG